LARSFPKVQLRIMQTLHYCRNVGNEKHGAIDDHARLFMVVLNNYERTPGLELL
jgi:hypothetical protein